MAGKKKSGDKTLQAGRQPKGKTDGADGSKATGKGTPARTSHVLHGIGVGPGIAIGTAYVHDAGRISAPRRRIASSKLDAECARLHVATETARHQFQVIREKARSMPDSAQEELGYMLDAYDQMLRSSRFLRGIETRIRTGFLNAEAAVEDEIAAMADAFAAMDDGYLAARIADVRDVGQRLLLTLTRRKERPFSDLPNDAVVIATDLSPADTALLNPKTVAGLATVLGGAESHTSILARSLGLPAAVAVTDLLKKAKSGDTIIVDGTTGEAVINPDPDTLKRYRSARADFLRGRRALQKLVHLTSETVDGVAVSLQANIDLPGEIDAVRDSGAEGVGLLRSEFMFMNRDVLPDEDEQTEILSGIVSQLDGRPVTIRTIDVGADKLGAALKMPPAGQNPALGLRAIRFALEHPDILTTQLAAILRAGAYGPVRILLPMIGTIEQVLATRKLLSDVWRKLRARGVRMAETPPPLGIMIEVPGAALAADVLAWHADFFSIGTNDLVQYTLAIDRSDDQVAALYNPAHPGVLRLIQFAAEAALKARIPVAVCGETAGDPRFTPLFLGFGIRELSMSAGSILKVKQRLRQIDAARAAQRAHLIMGHSDPRDAARLIASWEDIGG